MRQILVALGAGVALSALLGAAGAQQISFLPGIPFIVTHTPRLLTVADLNNDGFDDVLVGSSASRRVTILAGAADGNFSSVLTFGTPGSLHGISVGDINGDRCPDILTTHFAGSQVAFAFGEKNASGVCAGTFGKVTPQDILGRPVGAVLAEFDAGVGADAVIVNRFTNKVTCLKNRSGTQGFNRQGTSAAVGRGPILIASADFDGDGRPDVVTVNSRTRPVRDVSVLLGKGACAFNEPSDNYVVGTNPTALAVTDFNKDGLPDLLVLNAGRTTRGGDFSVSVLQNHTVITNGKPVSTGRFDQLPPVRVQCPLGRGGALGRCFPVAIAAGDFNGDGFADLAIAMRGSSRGSSTRGFVQYYAGSGDGRFEEHGRISITGSPVAIGAGNFNDDTLTDLVVSQSVTHGVQLLLSAQAPSDD